MKEIHENLFIGDAHDYETCKHSPGWFFVQACKEPYHREVLGYAGRAPAKNHPEYLRAYRDNRMICNLVDADEERYFQKHLMQEIIVCIHNSSQKAKRISSIVIKACQEALATVFSIYRKLTISMTCRSTRLNGCLKRRFIRIIFRRIESERLFEIIGKKSGYKRPKF